MVTFDQSSHLEPDRESDSEPCFGERESSSLVAGTFAVLGIFAARDFYRAYEVTHAHEEVAEPGLNDLRAQGCGHTSESRLALELGMQTLFSDLNRTHVRGSQDDEVGMRRAILAAHGALLESWQAGVSAEDVLLTFRSESATTAVHPDLEYVLPDVANALLMPLMKHAEYDENLFWDLSDVVEFVLIENAFAFNSADEETSESVISSGFLAPAVFALSEIGRTMGLDAPAIAFMILRDPTLAETGPDIFDSEIPTTPVEDFERGRGELAVSLVDRYPALARGVAQGILSSAGMRGEDTDPIERSLAFGAERILIELEERERDLTSPQIRSLYYSHTRK